MELLSLFRYAAQLIQDEASNGLVVIIFGQLYTQFLIHLIYAHQTVYLHRMLINLYQRMFRHPLIGSPLSLLLTLAT